MHMPQPRFDPAQEPSVLTQFSRGDGSLGGKGKTELLFDGGHVTAVAGFFGPLDDVSYPD